MSGRKKPVQKVRHNKSALPIGTGIAAEYGDPDDVQGLDENCLGVLHSTMAAHYNTTSGSTQPRKTRDEYKDCYEATDIAVMAAMSDVTFNVTFYDIDKDDTTLPLIDNAIALCDGDGDVQSVIGEQGFRFAKYAPVYSADEEIRDNEELFTEMLTQRRAEELRAMSEKARAIEQKYTTEASRARDDYKKDRRELAGRKNYFDEMLSSVGFSITGGEKLKARLRSIATSKGSPFSKTDVTLPTVILVREGDEDNSTLHIAGTLEDLDNFCDKNGMDITTAQNVYGDERKLKHLVSETRLAFLKSIDVTSRDGELPSVELKDQLLNRALEAVGIVWTEGFVSYATYKELMGNSMRIGHDTTRKGYEEWIKYMKTRLVGYKQLSSNWKGGYVATPDNDVESITIITVVDENSAGNKEGSAEERYVNRTLKHMYPDNHAMRNDGKEDARLGYLVRVAMARMMLITKNLSEAENHCQDFLLQRFISACGSQANIFDGMKLNEIAPPGSTPLNQTGIVRYLASTNGHEDTPFGIFGLLLLRAHESPQKGINFRHTVTRNRIKTVVGAHVSDIVLGGRLSPELWKGVHTVYHYTRATAYRWVNETYAEVNWCLDPVYIGALQSKPDIDTSKLPGYNSHLCSLYNQVLKFEIDIRLNGYEPSMAGCIRDSGESGLRSSLYATAAPKQSADTMKKVVTGAAAIKQVLSETQEKEIKALGQAVNVREALLDDSAVYLAQFLDSSSVTPGLVGAEFQAKIDRISTILGTRGTKRPNPSGIATVQVDHAAAPAAYNNAMFNEFMAHAAAQGLFTQNQGQPPAPQN